MPPTCFLRPFVSEPDCTGARAVFKSELASRVELILRLAAEGSDCGDGKWSANCEGDEGNEPHADMLIDTNGLDLAGIAFLAASRLI
jgi:hypothetical protein